MPDVLVASAGPTCRLLDANLTGERETAAEVGLSDRASMQIRRVRTEQ